MEVLAADVRAFLAGEEVEGKQTLEFWRGWWWWDARTAWGRGRAVAEAEIILVLFLAFHTHSLSLSLEPVRSRVNGRFHSHT